MVHRIARRLVLAGALGGVAGAARAQSRFAGRQLVAQGFGGPTQDVIQSVVFDPLDKRLGCTSTQVPLQSAAAFARMRAEAADPQIDMYQFSGGQEQSAEADGLLAPLGDPAHLADVPASLRDPKGMWVDYAVIAEGILYRTDKIASPPRSYKDFLKPEYQGHIAFAAITNGYGTDFVVMLARAFGGGEKDIDPGFKALAKIAEHATIFRAASEVPGLFAQGGIWMIPYDTGAAKRCKDAGLPVAFATPEEGSPASFCSVCIAAKSKNVDLAREAVGQFIAPDSQAAIAERLAWTPTNAKTPLPPALAASLPKVSQLVRLDSTLITENRSRWTERWNREIAH